MGSPTPLPPPGHVTYSFLQKIIREQQFPLAENNPFTGIKSILFLGSGSINLFEDFIKQFSNSLKDCQFDLITPGHLATQYEQLTPGTHRIFSQNEPGQLRPEFIGEYLHEHSRDIDIVVVLFNNVHGVGYQNILSPIATIADSIPVFGFNAQHKLLVLHRESIKKHLKAMKLHLKLAQWYSRKMGDLGEI